MRASPSGKAPASQAGIRGFESRCPLQKCDRRWKRRLFVFYLLTSFVLGRYNKPEFHYSGAYVAGRLGTCAFIIVVALITNFDPFVTLVGNVAAVYFALWHEWVLYHGRLRIVAFGRSLGWTADNMLEAGYTFTTPEGRRAIAHAVRESMGPDGETDAESREAEGRRN